MMYLVGKNLGIKDEFNLCTGDLNECKAYCHEILVRKAESFFGMQFLSLFYPLEKLETF